MVITCKSVHSAADLAPIIPIDVDGVLLVVGCVKRRKKEEKKKKRNPSLDWTVLSISLAHPVPSHSWLHSVHPAGGHPLAGQ